MRFSRRHWAVLMTGCFRVSAAGAGDEFQPRQGRLLYDWVMEGPGVVKIENGHLLLHSRWQEELEQQAVDFKNGESTYKILEPIVQKKDPDRLEKYYLNGKFVGGHIQYWNRHPHPENFLIRIRFRPLNNRPLHMLTFCGRGVNGEDILDPALKPRFGLAAQYTMSDLDNYRISFFAGQRGTANLRKAPGRKLVAKGPDLASTRSETFHALEIIRWQGRLQFRCDGKVVIDWTDPEPLDDGFFSIRLMNMARGYYDDYEVYELKASPFG